MFAKGTNKKTHHISMNVFFATDRDENETAEIHERFGIDRDKLRYGITNVSIPFSHKIGEIEKPAYWFLRKNPNKHIMMHDIRTLRPSYFYKKLSYEIRKSDKKNTFIFIHGYNTSFEEAARRTAQITYDLGFNGAPVFYSWPSTGNELHYTIDAENIKWAQKNIENFLNEFIKKSKARNIYLIAHSMGSRALTRSYISVIKRSPFLKSRIKEIILAAPDIDSQIFKRDIAPAMTKIGKPVTLYASSEDYALKASRSFHGSPRAGESGNEIVIFPGIETIDATNVKTDLLGHSYFSKKRSVISDMYYVIREGFRANKRFGLSRVITNRGIYWKFKK